MYVQLSKLREESDILQLEIKLRQLRNEANNRTTTDNVLEKLKKYDKTVVDLYDKAKKELKYARYQSFLKRLIDGKHIYMLNATYDSKTKQLSVTPTTKATPRDRNEISKWLRKTVLLNKRKRKDKAKQRKAEDNIFQMSTPSAPYMNSQNNQTRKIIFSIFRRIPWYAGLGWVP